MEARTAIVWFNDPGHGWLRVPIADVRASSAEISTFSYMDSEYAYLEEDDDAGRFIAAIGKDTYAERYTVTEQHANRESFIRHLPSYR